MIALIQQMTIPYSFHHDAMCLPILSPNSPFRCATHVQNTTTGRIAKFKFLDVEPTVMFVRHVFKIRYTILHSDHAFIDRNMLMWNVMNLELDFSASSTGQILFQRSNPSCLFIRSIRFTNMQQPLKHGERTCCHGYF